MARQGAGKRTRAIPIVTKGLSENVWIDSGSAREADGVAFLVTGEVVSSKGGRALVDWSTPPFADKTIDAMTSFRNETGQVELLCSSAGTVSLVRRTYVETVISGRSVSRSPAEGDYFAQHADWLYITNGRDGNKKYNGSYVAPVGVAEAPSAPDVDLIHWATPAAMVNPYWAIAGDILLENSWNYRASFVNSAGQEGPASPRVPSFRPANISTFSTFTALDICTIKVTLPIPATEDLVAKNIYKRAADGNYYYWRTVAANVNVVYDDETPFSKAEQGEVLVESRGQPPAARWIQFFRGRAYYAGISGRESFIWYSNAGFPEEVPLFNFFDVGSNDGEPVTGMASFSDSVLVFKPSSMWQITSLASGDPVLTKIDNGVGSIAPRATIIAGDTILFVSRDGIYGFDGARASSLTNKLNHYWKNVAHDWIENAVAWKDEANKRIMFALPFDHEKELDTVLTFHYETGAWTTSEGRRITAAARYKEMNLLGVNVTRISEEYGHPKISIGDPGSPGSDDQDNTNSGEDPTNPLAINTFGDIYIDNLGHSLSTVGVDNRGGPFVESAGDLSSRVRFGPFDQTSVGWAYDESMEVLGIDLFLGFATAGTITLRVYKDREKEPTLTTTFPSNEGGTAANIQDNQDLTALAGWVTKVWGDKWSGRRQVRRRISFDTPVRCRDIEIEFEADPATTILGDTAVSQLQHFRIEGFVLWFAAKGSERQR